MSGSLVAMWLARAAVAAIVVVASVIAGGELRAARDGSVAAARPSATATAGAGSVQTATRPPVPSASGVDPIKGGVPVPSTRASGTPYVRPTMAPQPSPTYPDVRVSISGHITASGKPVPAASIRIYPANSFQNGPTPVPPTAAEAVTDASGAYRVSVPAGAYKIGAFVDETSAYAAGHFWVTWYGDAYNIGWSTALTALRDMTDVNIAMLRLVTVSGSVVGHDGVGVPNARVDASRGAGSIVFPLVSAFTDAKGSFTLRTTAMPMKIEAQANGTDRQRGVWTQVDLDVMGDTSGVRLVIDRGNIVTGVLRDGRGVPLAETNFGVTFADTGLPCLSSCGGRTDSLGRFAITAPSATVRFVTFAQPGAVALASNDHVISSDMTLDPVLVTR